MADRWGSHTRGKVLTRIFQFRNRNNNTIKLIPLSSKHRHVHSHRVPAPRPLSRNQQNPPALIDTECRGARLENRQLRSFDIMKEIVTIQVGSYANFVGSHFWNFQDELLGLADSPEADQAFKNHGLNMDALYRSGETQQGILTYTPRLVSVDYQGSLGSVSSRGMLYNEVAGTSDTLTWRGSVTTQKSHPLEKNLFLQSLYSEDNNNVERSRCDGGSSNSSAEVNDKDITECLEDGVQYWTDFSKVHYHPQSLYELSGSWTNIEEFNNYGIGREAFSLGLQAEEINERLRFFVEECDLPQGIQFVVDDSGGFSGVAGGFLENIADEYTNIPVLLYTVRSPDFGEKLTLSRKIHDAVSFSKLSAFSKLVVPLGLPSFSKSRITKYMHVEDRKRYHTSAIYAAAIYSMSLPSRLEPLGPNAQSSYTCGSVNINELVRMLAGQGRQNAVSILDVAMPAPAMIGNQVHQSLLKIFEPLTPEITSDAEDMQALESMSIHGAFASGSKRASVSEVQDAVQAAYSDAAVGPKFSHLSVAQCPLPIPLPFPSIFGNLIGQHGELYVTPVSEPKPRGSVEIHSLPMAARLRSSRAILPFLENRLENLRRLGIKRGAPRMELLNNWGLGKEDAEDMAEDLSSMIMKLNPVAQESSDSD